MAMTHVHHLPNEILAHIFTLGRRGFSTHDRASVAFLSTITAICKRWRDIGLSYSSLWTSIAFRAPETGSISIVTVLDRIEAYLERSRDASIDFLLMPGSYLIVGRAIIPRIFLHLQRCRTIRVQYTYNLEDGTSLHRLFPLPSSMSRLTELQIYHTTLPWSHESSFIIADPANHSPLAVLRLYGDRADATSISSTRISDLVVGLNVTLGSRLNEWQLLSQCALALTSLASFSFYEAAETSLPIILLPNLKQLSTSFEALRNVPGTISCPNIEELVLHDDKPYQRTMHSIEDPLPPYPPEYFPWPNLRVLKTDISSRIFKYTHLLAALSAITTITCYDQRYPEPNRPYSAGAATEFLWKHLDVFPILETLKIEPPAKRWDRATAHLVLGLVALFEKRPLVRVECPHVSLVHADKALEWIREKHPDRFTESAEDTFGTLDHLFQIGMEYDEN